MEVFTSYVLMRADKLETALFRIAVLSAPPHEFSYAEYIYMYMYTCRCAFGLSLVACAGSDCSWFDCLHRSSPQLPWYILYVPYCTLLHMYANIYRRIVDVVYMCIHML